MSERTRYIEIFRGEAEEHLNSLKDGLLMLEENPRDGELRSRVMRNAHTLKGTSRMMGFSTMGEVAHRMEDFLELAEANSSLLTSEAINTLLAGADYIREILAAVGAKKETPPVPPELMEQLTALSGREEETAPAPGGLPEDLGKSLEAILDDGDGEKTPAPSRERRGKTSVVINLDRNLNTIRVDIPVLDRLTDLVGQLSINRGKLRNKIHQARDVSEEATALVEAVPRLRRGAGKLKQSAQVLATRMDEFVQRATEDLDEMTQLLRDIQDETLQMRMLPISIILDDFYRLVRDHARSAGKVVDLQIEGGETKLDKKVLEDIVAPLIHMVTNAIDHGIEDPEVRVARGKPEAGLVRVRAVAKGDHATIEIYDDGKGLDPQTLRETAVARALLTAEEAQALSDEAACHLIFRSGFSTQENISGTSGRGVGMDVVKTNVEALKGDIGIESKLGGHTCFILSIPVTYSVLRSLIVEAGEEVSVIPLDFVVEILHLDRERIVRHGGRSWMPYQKESIPLAHLGSLLGYGKGASLQDADIRVVILSCRNERLGIIVDRILRREEVVVKSVGKFLQGMKLVSGATILRLGDPAIILNVFDLFDAAQGTREEIRPVETEGRTSHLLVVDDSVTARTVQKGILEGAGYAVDIARDGQEALRMIQGKTYDLVVTDIEMPRMDGFELTTTLKQDPETRNIPVIIVTSRSEDSERRRGIEAGARAYIIKGTFDQNVLIDTVRRLIG